MIEHLPSWNIYRSFNMGKWNIGWLGFAPKKWNTKASSFFTGSPEKHEQVSTLRPEQEPLYQQAVNAGLNPGAGGAFGTAADYYRDLLSNDSQTAQMMEAPEQRRFNEETIPGISEQFAGMGSGGLSSSGFRNAAINAGTDLSERLGAIRANLRSQGAAGLAGIGQQGLQNYSQDVMTQPGSEGFLSKVAPAAANAAVGYVTGGPPGALAAGASTFLSKNSFGANKVGANSSPYGNQQQYNQNSQLPSFNPRMR